MSSIVLSKEKKTIPQNKSSMSPIVPKTKTKQNVNHCFIYVLCNPLFYLKKKDNNNTKTKHEFYVTHCVI